MKRILLLHVSVGMGHLRAAQALARAFEQLPETTVTIEDTLNVAQPTFRRLYAGSYLGMSDRVPDVWSSYYAQTDRPTRLMTGIRALSTRFGVRGLPALLERTRPDAIICTHFLPVEALAQLRQPLPPIACVVTDYHAHQFWAFPQADSYFVPTEVARQQLIAAGVAPAHIHVSGLPVDPALNTPADPRAARQQFGLPAERAVVTLIGSGLAVARVQAIVAALLAQRLAATIVVATGRNQQLAAQLANAAHTAGTGLRVLETLPSLDPLIVASDLVISKAGGLTVSEVLARAVPMILPLPVPGQEQWNADYVISAGAGLGCETATAIAATAAALLGDPARCAAMRAAARAHARPAAAQMIAARVLADASQFSASSRPAAAAPARWWSFAKSH